MSKITVKRTSLFKTKGHIETVPFFDATKLPQTNQKNLNDKLSELISTHKGHTRRQRQ